MHFVVSEVDHVVKVPAEDTVVVTAVVTVLDINEATLDTVSVNVIKKFPDALHDNENVEEDEDGCDFTRETIVDVPRRFCTTTSTFLTTRNYSSFVVDDNSDIEKAAVPRYKSKSVNSDIFESLLLLLIINIS